MNNVMNCIIIDQYYCLSKACLNETSAVHVNDISYRNIKGTYDVRRTPIHFACSDTVACTNINLSEVELYPQEGQLLEDPFCWNAYGNQETLTIPPIDCLRDGEPHNAVEPSTYECYWYTRRFMVINIIEYCIEPKRPFSILGLHYFYFMLHPYLGFPLIVWWDVDKGLIFWAHIVIDWVLTLL